MFAPSKIRKDTPYHCAVSQPAPNDGERDWRPTRNHALTHRPLVVPDSAEIEIVLRTEDEVAYLSLDGQPGLDLSDGDRVRCRRSEHEVNLFRTGNNFFQVLRSKLKWGERQE